MDHINSILQSQKIFFNSGKSKKISYRLERLKVLKKVLIKRENEILQALNDDLAKCTFEAYTSEIGLVKLEINTCLKRLRKWAKPKKAKTPLYLFPSRSYVHKEPFGQTLIVGPFNFPFQLVMIPLVGAIAAGNTVVVKPSDKTLATSRVITKIIEDVFDEGHAVCVDGGLETGKLLLQKKWDFIFFTGSTIVGKIVAGAAAKNLTPVVLELGGKNPVIVDKDANLINAARKITWGKLLNAGQSCVAPDTLYVHESIRERFQELLITEFHKFISISKERNEFSKIVDDNNIKRLQQLLDGEKIGFGGRVNEQWLEPTIVLDADARSNIMKEEIFGPILSVQSFENLNDLIQLLQSKEKPLALYYFSENKLNQQKVLRELSSGDAGINEVVLHFVNNNLPFGGVGSSGIGKYHGKYNFDTFSHSKSVIKSTTFFDLPFRYVPYKNMHYKLLRFLMK